MQSACALPVPLLRVSRLRCLRALDFHRSKTDAFAFLEDVILGNRLTVDSNEIILGFPVRNDATEKLLDGLTDLDFHVVGKTATVVVYDQEFHAMFLEMDDEIKRATVGIRDDASLNRGGPRTEAERLFIDIPFIDNGAKATSR